MEAVWMSVKRFSQLKKHSMGWRTELANVENVSPETRTSPLCFFRGVSNSNAWFCFSDCAQLASIYALSAYSRPGFNAA